MSDSRTIRVEQAFDVSIATSSSAHVMTILGDSPGGKRLRVEIRMDTDWMLGQIGQQLHQALQSREEELRRVRQLIEGKA